MYTLITGPVIDGLARGRTIGFPTLNIQVDDSTLPTGVFSALVTFDNVINAFAAVHIGPRLTVGAPFSCEVHVIDMHIYEAPKTITVQLQKKLRDTIKFDSVDKLQKQLRQDVKTAKIELSDQDF